MSNSKGISEEILDRYDEVHRAWTTESAMWPSMSVHAQWKETRTELLDRLRSLLEEVDHWKQCFTDSNMDWARVGNELLDERNKTDALQKENERITKERDEKQRSIQSLSEQFSELIDERNQAREQLEQIAKYQRDQDESPLHAYDECKRIARSILDQYKT